MDIPHSSLPLLIVAALLSAVACAIIRKIAELLLEISIAAAASLVLGLCAALAASANGLEGDAIGILVSVLLVVPAMRIIRAQHAHLLKRSKEHSASRAQAKTVPKGRCRAYCEKPINSAETQDLVGAWLTAWKLAPDARLLAARSSCARLLIIAQQAGELDSLLIEQSCFLRRQIPGLVSDAQKAIASLERYEANCAVKALIEALVDLGDVAERLVNAHGKRALGEFELRCGHVAARGGEFIDNMRSSGLDP